MIASPKPDLVTVNIDGREIAVPKGTNVIEAARLVGVDVPHYCYHPKLSVVGNCRMCLVEMGTLAVDPATKAPVIDPATGRQKINWIPRPQIACGTNASPGLHIRTTTPLVRDCREGVMEFLLINHPLDCPICDQAGECKLQEQSTGYGRGYSRYIEQKNVKPKRTQLGPRVTLDDERCILCSRCIRFCKEIVKDDVLGFIDRGSYSTLTCFPGRPLANNYSLNTVDLCPVGALTSSDFRFKMRVWFLKQTNSIDTESSVGANTTVWSREGAIYRITPRRNAEVNDEWMPDSGRVRYKQVQSPQRLTAARAHGAATTLDGAISAAAEILKVARGAPAQPAAGGAVALVGSAHSSLEEQFLARKLATALGARTAVVGHVSTGDRLLISADRTPNLRGALITGLTTTLPYGAAPAATRSPIADAPASETIVASGLADLGRAIDAGEVKSLVVIGEDVVPAGITPAQLAKVAVVYLGTTSNATSVAAKVVIPTATVFEKNGSFINQQFRLQGFRRAVPVLAGAHDDLVVLAALLAAVGGGTAPIESGALWSQLAAEVPALATISFASLPDTGLLLDATPWAALPFIEGESLHFKGPSAAANPEAGKPSTPSNT